MTQIAQTRPAGGAANAAARQPAPQAKHIDKAPSLEKAAQPTQTEDVPVHGDSGCRQHCAQSLGD